VRQRPCRSEHYSGSASALTREAVPMNGALPGLDAFVRRGATVRPSPSRRPLADTDASSAFFHSGDVAKPQSVRIRSIGRIAF
jgi:hypothetical protein